MRPSPNYFGHLLNDVVDCVVTLHIETTGTHTLSGAENDNVERAKFLSSVDEDCRGH